MGNKQFSIAKKLALPHNVYQRDSRHLAQTSRKRTSKEFKYPENVIQTILSSGKPLPLVLLLDLSPISIPPISSGMTTHPSLSAPPLLREVRMRPSF
mmetsp:Transcript_16072/g.33251  ORF Transcript_16072/g.33251 Transcript_16072/m.33251 type:complete len:97 (-) Transcript_16072:960-1250(-)